MVRVYTSYKIWVREYVISVKVRQYERDMEGIGKYTQRSRKIMEKVLSITSGITGVMNQDINISKIITKGVAPNIRLMENV